VPKENPPKIIVNSQPYTWQEGEAMLFDDSWPHEVVNHATDYRAILIIDVLRPLPFFPSLVTKFAVKCIAKNTYGRMVSKRLKDFNQAMK